MCKNKYFPYRKCRKCFHEIPKLFFNFDFKEYNTRSSKELEGPLSLKIPWNKIKILGP